MHHYGEDAVEVEINDDVFTIHLTNHVTGAKMTLSGPTEGIFSKTGRKMEHGEAQALGREIAHLLRKQID